MARPRILSIGHSNHDLQHLIGLLKDAGITAVADVRSQPHSKRHPDFNKSELRAGLELQDIAYAFLGDQLGGRPHGEEMYDADGRVNYERVRQTAVFKLGLDRLCSATEDYTIAMLCSEEDPLDCHRGLMVAPALIERGIHPVHVRGDGRLETTPDLEDRLLAATKVGLGIMDGLFAAAISEEERKEMLAEAYRIQARKKGFRLRPDLASGQAAISAVEDEGE